MTKAETMRKITDKANAERHTKLVMQNKKYAEKLITTKAVRKALDGRGSYKFALRRKYVPSLVVNALTDMGFDVIRDSKNGKAVLTIKW